MKSDILWACHRGLRIDGARENTFASFDKAIEAGFLILETDLRLTKDGHLALVHDPSLKRIIGVDVFVAEATRTELEAYGIIFFDQFIQRYAGYSWIFDIKPEHGFETVAALTKWIDDHQAQGWFTERAFFLFWDKQQRKRLADFLPSARIFATEAECWRAGLSVLFGLPFLAGISAKSWYGLPYKLGPFVLFRKSMAEPFHSREAKVIAYLPSTPEQAKQACEAGFDMVLTDHNHKW